MCLVFSSQTYKHDENVLFQGFKYSELAVEKDVQVDS